jgi:glycosyltransferase involved in cell wall biosynthesis
VTQVQCALPESAFKLSICIPTYNRAHLIGATLDSILAQLTDECEIIVSDNASVDSTKEVVATYASRCARVRYRRNDENVGPDRNHDLAVQLARGEYCWLMADDDVMKDGAIQAVLHKIHESPYSLVVVNGEIRNIDLSKVLRRPMFDVKEERIYGPEDMDRLAVDTEALVVTSCLVLKRALWISRSREQYYGSMFVHVGVILQQRLPSPAVMIADPFIIHRYGHYRPFWSDLFELTVITLPSLIWSFPLGTAAKKRLCPKDPWRSIGGLLFCRGAGWYSHAEYKKFVRPRLRTRREGILPALVSLLPGRLVNTLLWYYFPIVYWHTWRSWRQLLQQSPFYVGRQ